MADAAVVITAGTGTNIDTRTEATNGNHRQVIVLGDPSTNAGVAPVDATAGLKVDLGADNDITGTVTANLSATDNAVLDAIEVDTTTIAGAVSGTEMQVDVLSSALPTGASTAAKQPALGTAGTASTDVITVQGIASMTALKVDGSAVTQPVSGTFWQATQPVSGTVTANGDVASGSADSGNPVKIGGKYNSTKPSLTDGQRGDLQLGSRGSVSVTLFNQDTTQAVGTGLADNGDAVAVTTSAVRMGVMSRNTVYNGTSWDRMRGDATDGLLVNLGTNNDVTINGTVTVGSHNVTNAGTFAVQAAQSGTWNIATVTAVTAISNALPAGTNAIGKLAANSGVDIGDVDVTSLPALAAGTNLIGRVSSSDETSTVYNGTTALTPKFAAIDAATSGDNTLVAAVNPKKIRVLACFMVAAGAVNARFESGAGGTALSGQMNLTTNSGFVLPYNPVGWFETASNTLLNLELSGAVSVDGSLVYVEV